MFTCNQDKWRRSKRKSQRWTWILLSEGQTLPYYTKGTSRTKIRPSHVKRLTNAALGRLQAFRMYGGMGMSASSLHRESTDSLIHMYLHILVYIEKIEEISKILLCVYTHVYKIYL